MQWLSSSLQSQAMYGMFAQSSAAIDMLDQRQAQCLMMLGEVVDLPSMETSPVYEQSIQNHAGVSQTKPKRVNGCLHFSYWPLYNIYY